jgi:hypothetical protein
MRCLDRVGIAKPGAVDHMSIITVDQLKKKVRWQNVVVERGVHTFEGLEHSFCIYRVLPGNRNWPSIDLHFDGDIRILDPLGFSRWHGHYDRWSNDRRNLIDALRTVRELVEGKICLIEELGTNGDYRGGSLLPPDAVPGTLAKDVRQFRRVFFDRPPILEEIDFRRYWEGKSLLVEWNTKEETERLWKEYGMPIEW